MPAAEGVCGLVHLDQRGQPAAHDNEADDAQHSEQEDVEAHRPQHRDTAGDDAHDQDR